MADPIEELSAEIHESIEGFAWKVNSSLHDQTHLADAKASALILFAAALFAALASRKTTLEAANKQITHLSSELTSLAFVLFLLCGVFGLISVIPRVRAASSKAHIAFGDILAHGSVDALYRSLIKTSENVRLRETLESNFAVAQINSRKFFWIRAAMLPLSLGIVAAGASILL